MVVVIKHWNTIRDSKSLQDMIDQIAQGALPHAKDVLKELLHRAALTMPQEGLDT